MVTFEDDAGAYDQRDAEGFIKLNVPPGGASSRVREARPRLIRAPPLFPQRLRPRRSPKGPSRPPWEGGPLRCRWSFLGFFPLSSLAFLLLWTSAGTWDRYKVAADLALQQWFSLQWLPIGNLGVDLLVVPLAKLAGVELATKLVVMSIPPLTVAGMLWVAREVHNRLPPTVAFALPLAFGHPFMFGFVNFALSMAWPWWRSACGCGWAGWASRGCAPSCSCRSASSCTSLTPSDGDAGAPLLLGRSGTSARPRPQLVDVGPQGRLSCDGDGVAAGADRAVADGGDRRPDPSLVRLGL